MFIPVEVRPSTIFGKGLFPLRDLARGTVICSFTTDSKIITEQEYLAAIEENRYLVVRTGTRYVGKYFTYTDDPNTDLNFFNHAFEPNLLVHCGVVIALRDIAAGEELTIDYRYLIDDTEIGVYNDSRSARPIRGLPARQTLLETSRRMIELLEQLDDTWQG
ncbi:MAG TPA: SET domain-containing protein [Tepidisphaeraceae bacterium]|jgi:SET domain-containing protein|nr:SET domain-containing protein [Tepidisphaeraceae bacterium]